MNRREFLSESAAAMALLGAGATAGCHRDQGLFGPHAEIRYHNGSPALFVGGEPLPPMTYCGNPIMPDYIRALGESGIRVFFIMGEYDWFKAGSFEAFRRQAELILANAPNAYLVLRTSLHPPVQWLKDHPEELVRYENGQPMLPRGVPEAFEPVGIYSLASPKWREDGRKALLEFIDHVAGADFGRRVIGFFLAAGGTDEWYYPGAVTTKEHYTDCSPSFKLSYARILRETYGSVEELRAAWNNPQASFENPPIPNLDHRAFSRVDDEVLAAYRKNPREITAPRGDSHIGAFLNPETCQFVADYYRAWNYGTADSIIHFAGIIKEKTGNSKLVGAFYGSYGCTHFQNAGTVSGVLRILDSGSVDFLAAPGNYENRHPGGVTAQREMQDSFRLRKAIFLVEEDTRTHLADELNRSFTGTRTLADTLTNMKRDFGRNVSEDLQAWWFDMAARGGWYDHPEILSLMARQQEIARKAYQFDRSRRPEIALLYDQDSTWYAGQRTHVDLCHMMRDLEIHRIGAPVAYHFHDDLARNDMPDYKLYVFMNVFVLSDQERQAVKARLEAGEKTALWLYASGVINPDRKPRFSVAHMEELTGLRIASLPGPVWPACRLTAGSQEILRGISRERDYGYFDREMSGNVANVQPPGPAWTTLLCPCFYGDDPQARVLARFAANGKPALIARDFGEWRSIFAGIKAVRADLLRAVARYAGCHVYSETDDVLYANQHFVTLHASGDGEKIIRLSEPSEPFEIYECRDYGEETREIRLTMNKGETKTFHLHGRI